MGNAVSAPTGGGTEDEKMKLQMRREAAILIEDATCARDLQNTLGVEFNETSATELLDQIDQFSLKHKLEHGFYDPVFLRALGCLLRLGLTIDRQLSASAYVKEFFTDQKQIGAPSVEGVALMSGVQSNKSLFVIKAPKDPSKDYLIHEYFVAAGGAFTDLDGQPKNIIGTNWLRKLCLNYAQIIAAFRCGPPEIDPLSKQLRSWCSTENPASYVSYVAYEKVDGQDMKDMAPTIDSVTFVTTIIQLAYALEIGQIYNGFTHYDLHYNNAIMRDMKREVLIPFVIADDLTVYIQSRYIPTIIDYGRCHIQTPSPAEEMAGAPTDHFGYYARGMESYGLFADRARPYYDIFKFLGFSLHAMAEAGNPAFEQVWVIMGFFGFKTREQVLRWLATSRNKDLFSLTEDAEKLGFCLSKQLAEGSACLPESAATMYDFLNYIEVQFNDVWKNKVFGYPMAGQEVLACGADCTDFEGAVMNMTAERASEIATGLGGMSDFRDIMRFRNNLNQRGIYFKNNFPESKYGPTLLESVDHFDEEIGKVFEITNGPYAEQIIELGEQVRAAYDRIGYPLTYSDQASTDPNAIAMELQKINGYLDRMSEFAKAYVEFKEFYEAGEDMTRISGFEPSAEMEEYLRSNINPLFQAYDNARGEIKRILERTPVPPEFAYYKQDLLVRTF